MICARVRRDTLIAQALKETDRSQAVRDYLRTLNRETATRAYRTVLR